MRPTFAKTALAALLAAVMLISCSCRAATTADAPTGMKKIEMDIDDYNFYIPLGWTEDLSTGVASAYLPDNASVSVMTVQLDADTPDIDAYWKKTEEDFKSTFGTGFEYEGENPQNTLLGGVEARKYTYKATVTGNEYRFMQVACLRRASALLQSYSYVYLFTYAAPADVFDSHLDDVGDMLTNFEFAEGGEESANGGSEG